MKVIYKYEISLETRQTLKMPSQHRILSVGVMEDKIFLWAEVNTYSYEANVDIVVFATGQQINIPVDHIKGFIGTFNLSGYVGHVYELI